MKTALNSGITQWVRRYAWAAALVIGAVLLFTAPSSGQAPPPTNNGSQLPRRIPPPRELDESMDSRATPIFYEKRLQVLNAAQHKSMVADTDRLLKLVSDLNSQIASSNSNSLTAEQLRMVAEIEKLAHSVRDKMRMSVRSAVNNDGGSIPPFAPR